MQLDRAATSGGEGYNEGVAALRLFSYPSSWVLWGPLGHKVPGAIPRETTPFPDPYPAAHRDLDH